MSVSLEYIQYVCEQIGHHDFITYKKMFGGCAIYYEKKVVALVCDNKLFVKPTEKGREFIKDVTEMPPYQGSKNYFLIEDQIEDKDWLNQLILITEKELPQPKPKKTRKG